MPIDDSQTFETVMLECGREFVDALANNKQYRNSWWDMKIPGLCKYNMFGVTVLPGIFQWIVAQTWAEESRTTNGNGGVFAKGAPKGKGLQMFDAFFTLPKTSALPEAPGVIDAVSFDRRIGFYEKTYGQRHDKRYPEMNMEWVIFSKAKGSNGFPVTSYHMNVHVTALVDTYGARPEHVFQDFGFTLTDPSGNATTVRV